MRKVVSEAWLRDEIAAHMSHPGWDPKTFWARPLRCKPKDDGPNWRYSFNPGAVPAGFEKRWESIRSKFEDVYDIADDRPG
ncbi:MAG: hypothetical protein WCA81_04850 [Rhizomicrobium sp.]